MKILQLSSPIIALASVGWTMPTSILAVSREATQNRNPAYDKVKKHLNMQFENHLTTTLSSSSPRSLDGSIRRSNNRDLQATPKTQPLRITFETSSLQATAAKGDAQTKLRADTIIDTVLPSIQTQYNKLLSVVPLDNLIVPPDMCFGLFEDFIPSDWSLSGVQNTDLVILISASDSLFDQELCSSEPGESSVLAVASACSLDLESLRPAIGFSNLCLDALDLNSNGRIDESSITKMTDVLSHELIHVLGLNSILFNYYRNSVTDEPLTPYETNVFGSPTFQERKFKCVNDANDETRPHVCANTLQYKTEQTRVGTNRFTERGYYEIVLPTVRQVVRNQFNCQRLTGARLENQPTSQDCTGSHFDERFFHTDILSAFYNGEDGAYFSPLSLALLEDTGWYKVNFTIAENDPFGLNAGCDFVESDCIVDGEVPDYSKGFFCNDLSSERRWQCGPSHHYRGICDLSKSSFPDRTYFPFNNYGPSFENADWCPLISNADGIGCGELNAVKIDVMEVFGADSRCMEVTINNAAKSTALCIEGKCNADEQVFVFSIGSSEFKCGWDDTGLTRQEVSGGKTYSITCPPLTQVCQDMFCPAMCSGKGVCNWEANPTPVCECFDQNDSSAGCFESSVISAIDCPDPNPDPNMASNFVLAQWSVIFTVFAMAIVL